MQYKKKEKFPRLKIAFTTIPNYTYNKKESMNECYKNYNKKFLLQS